MNNIIYETKGDFMRKRRKDRLLEEENYKTYE
jgi:hypothetical protein